MSNNDYGRNNEDYSLPITHKGHIPDKYNDKDVWAESSPFYEFGRAFSDVMKLFDRFANHMNSMAGFPDTDIQQADGNLIIKVNVPGLNRNNLNVEIFEDYIRLSGKQHRRNEYTGLNQNTYQINEYSNSFFRTLPLPCKVRKEEAKIDYRGDTLVITVPEVK